MRKFIVATLFLGLIGCSSTPETRSVSAVNERDEYASHVEKQLNELQSDINDLEGFKKNELQASLQDARAELRGLRSSSDVAWRTYKVRLDRDVEYLRQKFNQAKAAE